MPEFKVMVPLDGSRTAEHSLAYLDGLKSLGESEVLLFSVVDESEDFHTLSTDEARERERNLLSTYLREVSSDIEKHLGLRVETRVSSGQPADSILEEAHRYEPDLLVISTHGRSGTSRWRFGSVADKLIRGAASNTLVIGPAATERETWLEARIMAPFTKVLVPLDGSELAEEALPVAAQFVKAYGAVLHLVRSVTVPAAGDVYGEATYMPDLLNSLIEGAKSYLTDVATRLSGVGPVTIAAPVGSAAFELEEYVRQQGIDLVVMTSHGRSGFVRTALGSVTDRMLGGPAPVLVVRSAEASA